MGEHSVQTRRSAKQAARDAPRGPRARGAHVNGGGAAALAAVGYLRRSTDRQEQSIPDQRKAVERFAEERGLVIARFYTDDAISGTSTVGRKAFQSLIADAGLPTRDFAFVICYDVKRFGRIDNDEAGYYRHILKSHGVEVLYASENFTGDGTDDLLRPVKQWQARQESKDLAKVTIRGLLSKAGSGPSAGSSARAPNQERAAGGWWMGGAPPYGYDLRYESQTGQPLFTLRYLSDGSKQMLDEEGAIVRGLGRDETVAVSRRDRCKLVPGDASRVKTVEAIFRMYVEERRGFKAITDRLNASEAPTARGPGWSSRCSGRWAMGTVRAILMNPAYKGDMVWNRRTDGRFFRIADGVAVERKGVQGRRLEPNAESDWIITEDAHPALVPRRIWERAKKRREAMGALGAPGAPNAREALPGERCWRGSREKFLLSGLCECGACGNRYEGVTQPSTRRAKTGEPSGSRAYACGGYIRHGPSTCARGAIAKDAIESAVVKAVVGAYEKFAAPDGKAAIREEFERRFGVEREDAARARTAALAEIDRLERTTRSLLDNITKTNKAAVDKRLVEIESERAALERTLDEAARTAVSHREVEAMVRETAAFIAALPGVLAGDDAGSGPGARQAALRRCVERVVIRRDKAAVTVDVRTLPTMANGPETSAVVTVEAALTRRASRASA